MAKDDQSATKRDLKLLKTEIVDEISNVLADSMTSIGINFENLNKDVQDVKTTINRIEQKMNPTIDHVDVLEIRVKKLENKPA